MGISEIINSKTRRFNIVVKNQYDRKKWFIKSNISVSPSKNPQGFSNIWNILKIELIFAPCKLAGLLTKDIIDAPTDDTPGT